MSKQCNNCGEVKDPTQYSKCSSSKDGLQPRCKKCNKTDNLIFRTEKPEHHQQWQTINSDKHNEIVKRYRKANKTPKIYSIKNPNGEVYVGRTEMYLNVRKYEHTNHYKRASAGKRDRLPGLHDSFDKWGVESHTFETIVELEGYDRKQLGFVEASFIKAFQQIGKSLNLNK
jgi:hypothetical protein